MKIYCDMCGKDITEEYYRISIESGNYSNWGDYNGHLCVNCAELIEKIAKGKIKLKKNG